MKAKYYAAIWLLTVALLWSACTRDDGVVEVTRVIGGTAVSDTPAYLTPSPPPPTATAELIPTATSEPLPTATAVPCLDATATGYTPLAGNLRIEYETEDGRWLWREETGATELIQETMAPPAGFDEARLSPDGKRMALIRQIDAQSVELWVGDKNGANQHLLITASAADIFQRYPDAISVHLSFDWIGETPWLAYRFHPEFDGIGDVPLQALYAVDSESGRSWTLLPPDEMWQYRFTADSRQLLAFSAAGLRVVDTATGAVEGDLPLNVAVPWDNSITFTPDGQQALLFVVEGIALIDLADNAAQTIPLAYTTIGLGHHSWLPGIYWLDNTRFYTLTANGDSFDEIIAPEATFTTWEVDTAAVTVRPVNTFAGFVLEAKFSPDFRRLASWTQDFSNIRHLYLADVASGKQILYTRGRLLEILNWSPDSSHFVYWPAGTRQLLLGHICDEPRPLEGAKPPTAASMQWVDNNRFLALEGEFSEASGRYQLHLRSLDGSDILIQGFEQPDPLFRFYFGDS